MNANATVGYPDLIVQINPVDGDDAGHTEGLVLRLLGELSRLDIGSAERLPGLIPAERAKGLPSLAGGLVIRLGATSLKTMVTSIRDWVSRNGRTVEATIAGDTIKITGATLQQQEALINAWLVRHAAST